MPKINQEEYEVLKDLDDNRKWIARDEDGGIFLFVEKPYKHECFPQWRNQTLDWKVFETEGFQFIQWEDEEPYNIQELIDEYLDDEYGYFNMKLSREFEEFIKKSEETQMKKDVEWLKERVYKMIPSHGEMYSHPDYTTVLKTEILNTIIELIDQLDEPEVLTEELPVIPKFVAEYLDFAKSDTTLMRVLELANTRNEWEKWENEYDWIEENHELFARAWLDGFTIANEEEEQKYYVLDKEGATLLRKSAVGEGVAQSIGANIYNVKRWENEGKYRLTEQEIKDYDERYIPFMVPVEELEE